MSCKRTVPDEFPLCLQCGAALDGTGGLPAVPVRPAALQAPPKPAPASEKPRGPDPVQLRIDAKARVMWGEDRGAIRADLARQGHAAREVDRALDEAVRERRAHFRSIGMRDILLGSCCLGGFLLLIGILVLWRVGSGLRLMAVGKGVLGLFLLPPLGIFFLIRGLSRVAGGGKGEGSATDVADDD
jgi:hypothetical protein